MTGLERYSISFRELAHLAAKCALGADRKIHDVFWEIYEEKWLIPDEEQHLRGGNHPGTLRSLEGDTTRNTIRALARSRVEGRIVDYAILGCLLLFAGLARASEPAYSVERDNTVVCRTQPEQVAANPYGWKILSMRCTTRNKVAEISHDEDRVIWFARVVGYVCLPGAETCCDVGFYYV